jgi:hypothetical protein
MLMSNCAAVDAEVLDALAEITNLIAEISVWKSGCS